MNKQTHYQVLGVTPKATSAEIRYAYMTLMRANHPDRVLYTESQTADPSSVTAAYAVLKDAEKRRLYDIELQLFGPKECKKCKGKGTVSVMKNWVSSFKKCPTCQGSGRQ